MTNSRGANGAPAYFSWPGLLLGARAMVAPLLGQCAFGIVIGTQAAQHGFSIFEAVSMSALVYAGLSQAIGLQSWPEVISAGSLAVLALATATANVRFLLFGTTLRPWFSTLRAWQVYPMLFMMTDGGVLQALRYREAGGADASYYLGGSLSLYVTWPLSTAIGYYAASWLSNPKAFGLDLVIPAFFAALLVPAWKGVRHAVPWLVAALAAVVVQGLVQGYWFIIAGGIAGALTAGLMNDE